MNTDTYSAARQAAVWRDMSHFGRFSVGGADGGALLHHLTTNDIKALRPGAGCDAALLTSKARLLDVLSIFRRDHDFLVVTSPNRRAMFAPHAQKFILYRQDVRVADITDATALWGLFGPATQRFLDDFGVSDILEAPLNTPRKINRDGAEFYIAHTSRLPLSGVLLWSDEPAKLPELARGSGLPICDNETYNVLRIEAGVPVAGLEITEEVNPWEAALGSAISLHKGCYNGQEIIARLNTYKKVKQRLRGLKLQSAIPMGERVALECDGRNAGFITSSVLSPRFGPVALAYVRGDYASAGQQVEVVRGDERQSATIADLPFAD
jgi:folate-binding protein YgfZ